MKSLWCGGRSFLNGALIQHWMQIICYPGDTIVHGAAPGADSLAGAAAHTLGLEVRAYPANWSAHGKEAGPLRNQRMLDDEHPIDFAVAFPGIGRGTHDMLARLRAKHVPVAIGNGADVQGALEALRLRLGRRDPKPNEVFVFGSNLIGRHGAGAALAALQRWGAKSGQGEGLQGNSYAIPTKNHYLTALTLADIRVGVDRFITFAEQHSELTFLVTRVGCGLAGHTDIAVAPMFARAPKNCLLPNGWRSAA